MCGIFGLIVKRGAGIGLGYSKAIADNLYRLSESRGKEAAGLALQSGNIISVCKSACRPSRFILLKDYKSLFSGSFNFPFLFIGHTRLVTDGSRELNKNNQPIIKGGLIGVHNGIIVNQEMLWSQFRGIRKEYDVDSEIILSLLEEFLKNNKPIDEATKEVFSLIRGTASIAVLFNNLDNLLLATNNGSLYICCDKQKKVFLFASEESFLKKLVSLSKLNRMFNGLEITHLRPGSSLFVNVHNLEYKNLSLYKNEVSSLRLSYSNRSKQIIEKIPATKQISSARHENESLNINKLTGFANEYKLNEQQIALLKRCKICILPETMPFIEFDSEGICNYCKSYKKLDINGEHSLNQIAEKYRSHTERYDCIVGISGGRDSSYALHYIKTVLKMNPIAYTYDWGMVTDLARRNISRICGKLGIEHILISADIVQKRKYIKKNVQAWLKKPDLGIIPLFMAGDKHYFYYLRKLKNEHGLKLAFLAENPFERTDFKTGFSSVKQLHGDRDNRHTLSYVLSFSGKTKLMAYYIKEFLRNPSLLNSSIIDTISAYACYYLLPRDYLNIYRYIQWDEDRILDILIKEYDWELASDTKAIWRIGDGTASFYNYIYYMIAGFTENDTFRSNQIREGLISRKDAINKVCEENRPRFDSIFWYCKTIGINFEDTLKAINSAPKLYK